MITELKFGKKLAEGKTKIVYASDKLTEVILEFKDDITAGDGLKHDVIPGKGYLNCAISAKFFELLEKAGVPTHFLKYVPPKYMVVRSVKMLPVEFVCRNIAAGHILERLPVKLGDIFDSPLIEFFWKSDAHHDPMLNDMHMAFLKLANRAECDKLREITSKVNLALRKWLDTKGIVLVDFKIEMGRDSKGKFLVSDELNGDSCRLWAKADNGKIFDKDAYRKGKSLDEVKTVYINLFKQLLEQEPTFR
jgi:phosphoribosylaminoimidazole-succinocarboxamide synthase